MAPVSSSTYTQTMSMTTLKSNVTDTQPTQVPGMTTRGEAIRPRGGGCFVSDSWLYDSATEMLMSRQLGRTMRTAAAVASIADANLGDVAMILAGVGAAKTPMTVNWTS
ncbi:hypothetical protein FRC05_011446 [Tulasnella sp. 425]|nr:hypothetical protein FRC05_011446 [Tulasnella sp. 425]